MNKENLDRYIEWDIPTWSRAIIFWRRNLNLMKIGHQHLALEIGGRRGGLSYFIANEYNCNVICSDINNPISIAKPLHDSYNSALNISYQQENCLKLSFEDEKFDIIIFKSVIGALGKKEFQQQAVKEMWRCLKPGGKLLFAENSKSSILHQFLRKYFTKWNHYWYYPTVEEMEQYLSIFSNVSMKSTGFFSLFVRNVKLNILVSGLDRIIEKLIPNKLKYTVYGIATK